MCLAFLLLTSPYLVCLRHHGTSVRRFPASSPDLLHTTIIAMTSRKRDRKKLEADQSSEQPSLLDRIRNMWEFANIAQYLFLFGKAARIDEDYSIEVRIAYHQRAFMKSDWPVDC